MKMLERLGIRPAPWTMVVEDKRDYRLFSVEAENGAGIADFDCCPEQFDTHEGFANASLISAAPELYEALAALLNCAEKEAPFTTESGMSIAMDMARKALEKAGGEK